MSSPAAGEVERFAIVCIRCDRPVIVRRGWVGREVECPHCASVLRVPAPRDDGRPVRADPPQLVAKRFFHFACRRCECLLEAHTGMVGQVGQCPTCGARLLIPGVDRDTGLPLDAADVDEPAENPTPLHAYAAAGEQAPRIVRRPDGSDVIICPRCAERCPIDAERCTVCGTPFTLDATPTRTSFGRDRRALAALVLGILALPAAIVFIPGLLAIVYGCQSLRQRGWTGRPLSAAIGAALGGLSLPLGLILVLRL